MEIKRDADYAGAWGQEPVSVVYAVTAGLLQAALDHLRGLSRTLTPQPLIHAPSVLARASAEAASRAAWVTDPSLDVRRRLARGFTELLYSAHKERKLTQDDGTRREGVLYTGILKSAKDFGFEILDGPPPALDELRVSATELFKQLDDTEELGEFTFRVLSAGAHTTAYVALGQVASTAMGGLAASALLTATRWQEAYASMRFLGKAVARHLHLVGGDEQGAARYDSEVRDICTKQILGLGDVTGL